GPGSLVSAILITSLSPVCGLEVFTTPTPQSIWSTREQRPPRMFTKKVGTMKPGWSQHPCVPRGTQPFGLPATSHPGMPAQAAVGTMGGHVPTVVVVLEVVVVVVVAIVVVVVATVVVVVARVVLVVATVLVVDATVVLVEEGIVVVVDATVVVVDATVVVVSAT